jgi:hypothetical protein
MVLFLQHGADDTGSGDALENTLLRSIKCRDENASS